MARNQLPGDTAIRSIKPGDTRKRLSDGAGLYLLLFVKGGAHGWRFDYTSPVTGKRKTLSLGTYPDTSLAAARKKAQDAREAVAQGVDPSDTRKASKAQRVAVAETERLIADGKPLPGTFEFVARDWLVRVHGVKCSPGHADRTRIRLEQDAFPWLGRRPIGEIEAPELLECLRRVEARGAIETAHRIKDACGQVFRYGIATGDCKRNPAADLRDALKPVQTKHHAAIVDPVGTGKLLRAIAEYSGQLTTRIALQLSALLLLRPGELRHMEWAWLDLDAATLTVPAEAMKRDKADKANGPPHIVPLATQAVAALLELAPLTGQGCYVFPALTSRLRCMSENTVRSGLRRMGYGNDDMTAHGFRAMARTMAAERLGIAAEVIEAQLGHAVADSLGRAYNRTQYLDQRKDLMQQWADYLDKLREGAEVIAFKGKAA